MLIKQCTESVVDVICPEGKIDFCKMNLSRQTVTRRIDEIGKSMEAFHWESVQFQVLFIIYG